MIWSSAKKKNLEEHRAVDNSNSNIRTYEGVPIMTVKRKSDISVVSRSKKTDDTSPSPPPPADNAQDIFRKYFEAQFAPLDLPNPRATGNSNSEEYEEEYGDSEGSEMDEQWDGVSEDESDEDVVEVVEHTDTRAADDRMDKKAFKAFMVSITPRRPTVLILTMNISECETTIILRNQDHEINGKVK